MANFLAPRTFPFPEDDKIRAVEEVISYEFANRDLIREALQGPGFINREGNRTLALIGDAALKLSLIVQGQAKHASRRKREYRDGRRGNSELIFASLSLGEISDVVCDRASNDSLALQGFTRGLERYICNNPAQGTFVSHGTMATTMEAIIGAVFLDSGSQISAVDQVVVALGASWPE